MGGASCVTLRWPVWLAPFTAANELPALALLCLLGAALLLRSAADLVGILAGGAAGGGRSIWAPTIWPTARYASPTPIGTNGTCLPTRRGARRGDSYWMNPQGIDRGEPDIGTYALHTTVGHHGIFSLTPMWLLSVAGLTMWLAKRDRATWPWASWPCR